MNETGDIGEAGLIELPPPRGVGNLALMQALHARHSSREFAARPLSPQLLSNVLWAAGGVNRLASGGRTAPSANNWREVDVYAMTPDAAYRYHSASHALERVVASDLRDSTGLQDFVAVAPLDLVYVADFERMGEADAEDKAFYSATDTGFMAQNVYLACADAGLAVVVRGLIDRPRLADALALKPHQHIILAQSVGYPADA